MVCPQRSRHGTGLGGEKMVCHFWKWSAPSPGMPYYICANGLPLFEMVCNLSFCAVFHFRTLHGAFFPLCFILLAPRVLKNSQKVTWRMMTGTPPEYRRTAPDFLSQVAPLGLVLAEPHEASVEGQLLVVCSSPTLAGAQLMSIAFYRRPTRVGW